MTISERIYSRMRWRGIRSQSQLARLSGVSQSSIHHILTRGDDYNISRNTLRRLAAALDTTPAWLSGDPGVPPQPQEPGAPYAPDGYDAELHNLMAQLPASARRKIVDIVRLIVDGCPSIENPENGEDKKVLSDSE